MDEKMFDLRETSNPSNWLGPIWLVTQYCVFRGLMRYGYREQAEDLCARTLRLLGRDLEKTGTLHEYYNPFTGEPVMTPDFVNWNVLALNMADELRGKPSMEDLLT
jgi:putative isomerase